MPGKPDSFPSFDSFAKWRAFLLQFSLNSGIPHIVNARFERAQKLYVLAWQSRRIGRIDGARTRAERQIWRQRIIEA